MFKFLKKLKGYFSRNVLHPGQTGILQFRTEKPDLGFPEKPVIGQIHKVSICLSCEMDGKSIEKNTNLEFIFYGKDWIQIPKKMTVYKNGFLEVGGECE